MPNDLITKSQSSSCPWLYKEGSWKLRSYILLKKYWQTFVTLGAIVQPASQACIELKHFKEMVKLVWQLSKCTQDHTKTTPTFQASSFGNMKSLHGSFFQKKTQILQILLLAPPLHASQCQEVAFGKATSNKLKKKYSHKKCTWIYVPVVYTWQKSRSSNTVG